MIDKKKLRKTIKIICLCLTVILLIIFIKKAFSRYETNSRFEINTNVAFFIFNHSFQEEHVAVQDIAPSDTPYEYSFSVSNFKDSKVAETSLEYQMKISITTYIPLQYKVYKNDEQCEVNQSIQKDTNGTYYTILDIENTEKNKLEMQHGVKKTDNIKLEILFAKSSTNAQFADLVNDIKIATTAQQIVK